MNFGERSGEQSGEESEDQPTEVIKPNTGPRRARVNSRRSVGSSPGASPRVGDAAGASAQAGLLAGALSSNAKIRRAPGPSVIGDRNVQMFSVPVSGVPSGVPHALDDGSGRGGSSRSLAVALSSAGVSARHDEGGGAAPSVVSTPNPLLRTGSSESGLAGLASGLGSIPDFGDKRRLSSTRRGVGGIRLSPSGARNPFSSLSKNPWSCRILIGALALVAVAVVAAITFPVLEEECVIRGSGNGPDCFQDPILSSASMTETSSITGTGTASSFATQTQDPTSTQAQTQAQTQTQSHSLGASDTQTPSLTQAPTVSSSQSATSSQSLSVSASQSFTSTQLASLTSTGTSSPSGSATASQTDTPSATATPSLSSTATQTNTQTATTYTQMTLNACILAVQLNAQSLANCAASWVGSMGGATSSMHVEITAGALTGNLQSPWGSGSAVDLPFTNSDAEMQANLALVTVSASTLAQTVSMTGTGAHVAYSGKVPFQGRLLSEQVNESLHLRSGTDAYRSATMFADAYEADHGNLRGADQLTVLEE